MNRFPMGDIVALVALLILGGLAAGMMCIAIPTANAGPMNFVLGALAGALTVSGGQKVADKLSSPSATTQDPTP